MVEEEGLHDLAEISVVGDALVEVEVRVDDLLDHLLHLVVEGEADVFAGVDARGGVEGAVVFEAVEHLAEGDAVFRAEVEAEAFVQLGDDAGQRLHFVLGRALVDGARTGVEGAAAPRQIDRAPSRAPHAVRLHVDVLLHFQREFPRPPPAGAGADGGRRRAASPGPRPRT